MGEWPKPMWLWKMKKTKWGKCRILNLGEQKSQRIMYVNVYFCGGGSVTVKNSQLYRRKGKGKKRPGFHADEDKRKAMITTD